MRFTTVIVLLLLAKALCADEPATTNAAALRILFLGNSITLHGPAPHRT